MSEKVLNIMEFMDDLDDVQEVHTNAEFPDDFEVNIIIILAMMLA